MFSKVYFKLKWMIDQDWHTLSLDLVELTMLGMLIKCTSRYDSCLERAKKGK